MKHLLFVLFLVAALSSRGADTTFLGGTTTATSIPGFTNYVLMVYGSHTGAVYRLVNVSNLWLEAGLDLTSWTLAGGNETVLQVGHIVGVYTNLIGPDYMRMSANLDLGLGNNATNNIILSKEGHLEPATSDSHSLGASDAYWLDLFLSGYARVGTLRATNTIFAPSITTTNIPGTSRGYAALSASNNTQNVRLTVPENASVTVTQIFGLVHKAAAAVIEHNANNTHELSVTSRVSAATTLVYTNGADGQQLNTTLLGEASGGASRVITVQPHLGHLVADLDNHGTALATSFSFTLTNGNAVEISARIRRLNGTNVMGVVTRQFEF